MSNVELIRDLETKADHGTIKLEDISHLRHAIFRGDFDESIAHQILHVWNAAVRMSQRLEQITEGNNDEYRVIIIPEMRLLVVDVLRAHKERNREKLLYCCAYTFKAFLDARNDMMSERLFQEACQIFNESIPSAADTQVIVQAFVWRAQKLIEIGDHCGALGCLRSLTDTHEVESSYLMSYVYDMSLGLKSLDWCTYGISLASKNSILAGEWEEKMLLLKAQLLVQNNPEEARGLLEQLPQSLNVGYLKLKCQISVGCINDDLKNALFDFISKTAPDRKLLIALCLFVADHYALMGEIAVLFLKDVLSLPDLTNAQLGHVLFSAAKVASQGNNIGFARGLIRKVLEIDDKESTTSIAGVFWNQALDLEANGHYADALTWMQCAKELISDEDNQAQSCCCRFMSQCFSNQGDLGQALVFANEAIDRDPKSSFSYLAKLRTLERMGNKVEATKMVRDLLADSHLVHTFEATFFTSVSAELYEAGDILTSLDSLVIVIDQKPHAATKDMSQVITSAFSILQQIDDPVIRFRFISIISKKWNSDVNLTDQERTGIAGVAFATGSALAKNTRWKKAISCFQAGAKFAGNLVDLSILCSLEAVRGMIEIKAFQEAHDVMDSIIGQIELGTQKVKDWFLVTNLKLDLCTTTNSSKLVETIEEITTPEALADICDFLTTHQTNSDIVSAVLEQAKRIDDQEHQIIASLLHQLVTSAKTTEQLRQTYEMITRDDNFPKLTTDQTQFFMATAWNTGTQLAKARRLKESEWWFAQGLTLMKSDQSLCETYQTDLEERYAKFLEFQNGRASFQF